VQEALGKGVSIVDIKLAPSVRSIVMCGGNSNHWGVWSDTALNNIIFMKEKDIVTAIEVRAHVPSSLSSLLPRMLTCLWSYPLTLPLSIHERALLAISSYEIYVRCVFISSLRACVYRSYKPLTMSTAAFPRR
jgi:hypothetical protein